jgi:hypothetical protein
MLRTTRCELPPLRGPVPEDVPRTQRLLTVHAAVYNLFNLGRNLVSAKYHRLLKPLSLASWEDATAL